MTNNIETSTALPCVAVTDNHSLFKGMEGNRVINQNHVKKLVRSFTENGQIPVPIIVNEEMTVIDGHHRLEALKSLDLPVFYLTIEGLRLDDVITLNHDQVKWNLKDFVGSWAKRGNQHYKTFESLLMGNPMFNVHMLYAVVKGKIGMAGNEVREEIEKGKLTITVDVLEIARVAEAWSTQLEWLKQNKASVKKEITFSLLKLISEGHNILPLLYHLDENSKQKNSFIGYLQRTDGYNTIHSYILRKFSEVVAMQAAAV